MKKNEIIVSQNFSSPEDLEAENKKRMFLKLAGLIGVGAVASLLIPKKADALIFGSTPASNVVGLKDHLGNKIDPAQEAGGHLENIDTGPTGHSANIDTSTATIATNTGTIITNIGNVSAYTSSINTNTAPFSAVGAGGYIQQDSNATIAKETGGNLATIATNTGKFRFDGDSNLKIAASATITAGDVNLRDASSTRINPATDDSIVYLRRMVKLMESQGTVDSANRQRVTIDGTVTTSASTTISTLASQNQQMFQDPARTAYAVGIRNNLIFS